MSRRSRLRRITKWTGVAVCVVVPAVFVWSVWWTLNLQVGDVFMDIYSGSLGIHFGELIDELIYLNPHKFGVSHWNFWRWSPTIQIPLWALFVLVAIPTAILFYRDRRRSGPNHCQQCGYNLTGNVSGICPECGTKV